MKAKPQIQAAPENRQSAPEYPWDSRLPLGVRLLNVRKALRTVKLFKEFQLQRTFDAFSIHILAREVESVLNDHGLISDWKTIRWTKSGNHTLIEGVYTISNVEEDGDVREFPAIGEGIDNGDKGSGKALSTARKNAMIAALNLGVGIDIEETEETAEAPIQATSDVQQQAAPQAPAGTVDLLFMGRPVSIPEADLVATVTTYLTTMTSAQINDFSRANVVAFRRIRESNKGLSEELQKAFDAARKRVTPQAAE